MYREEIESYFEAHQREMIEDIKKLVSICSTRSAAEPGKPYGAGPAAALEKALELAGGYGFDSVRNVDNHVGVITYGDGDAKLGILAHLDVVPAGSGWTVCAPYGPVERDGRIYGRGTSDDKGPAVASLYALRCVKDLGIPLKHQVRLILGAAEETGSEDIEYYFKKEAPPPMVFSPDGNFPILNTEKGQIRFDIMAEFPPSAALPRILSVDGGIARNAVPSQASAVVEGIDAAEAGEILRRVEEKTGASYEVQTVDGTLHITACGKNAHASLPEDGNNAITALIAALLELPLAPCEGVEKLRALYELIPHAETDGTSWGISCADELSGALTISLDIFHASQTEFHAYLDSRVPVSGNVEKLYSIIEERAVSLGLKAELSALEPPHHTPEDAPLVVALKKIYESYTGRPAHCTSMGGGTYVHNIDGGVGFGCEFPEEDTCMHGPDEWVSVDTLLLSAKMFASAIVELCQ